MAVGQEHYHMVDLKPGEIHVAQRPTIITTLLGSCVSVCLYSVQDAVGAMSHSILPFPKYRPTGSDVRYVECALDRMMGEMRSLGVAAGRIEAKMFGGAEMFHRSDRDIRIARIVGDGNTDAARGFLERCGVRVVSECVGGNYGRKVIFNTATGMVMVKKLTHGLPTVEFGPDRGRCA